ILRQGINGEVQVTYKDYPLFKGPSKYVTYFGNCTIEFFDDGGGCLKYVESASDEHGNTACYSDWENHYAKNPTDNLWFLDPLELLSDDEYTDLLTVLEHATKKE